MQRLIFTSLASVAVLGLAACGDEPADNATVIEDTPALSVNDLGPDTNVQLNEEQQARYDATDWEATSEEYDRNYEAMMAESSGTAMAAGGGTQAAPADASTSSTSSSASSGMTMPSRGQMDFTFLDRNDDGRLSVAEYAIWAVGVNPTEPKPNDQTRPYLRPEQINEAGQTFFYFDQDGNTYLSESEFQMARDSGRTA